MYERLSMSLAGLYTASYIRDKKSAATFRVPARYLNCISNSCRANAHRVNFALLGADDVLLTAARLQGSGILAARSEQDEFRDISKVESNSPSIRPAIFADLVPDQIRFVGEPPRVQDLQPFRQQGIRNP